MFDELVLKVKEGAVLRVAKGTVHLAVPVEKIEENSYEYMCRELRLVVAGGSSVYIYDCDTITKTRRPNDFNNEFEWCFRVVDEEDAVFYVTNR